MLWDGRGQSNINLGRIRDSGGEMGFELIWKEAVIGCVLGVYPCAADTSLPREATVATYNELAGEERNS